MYDPYDHGPTNDAIAPATAVYPITPSDTVPLAVAAKAVRIFAAAAGTIAIKTVTGQSVTLSVPAGLTIERIRVAQVLATGTTAGLELFAYSDASEAATGSE